MPASGLIEILTPIVIVVVAALVAIAVVNFVLRRSRARWQTPWRVWQAIARPLTASVLSTSLLVAVAAVLPTGEVKSAIRHGLVIAVIASVVWLAATLCLYALRLSERRLTNRQVSDRDRRRTQTKLVLTRRLVGVGFVVLGTGLILLTFPGMDRIGAGILASAGVLSVIAGLAGQSTLANLIAGVQLAFSDAVRIDDVVVIEDEWGRIEDITLTYVVVRIWDERRLILPSTYFVTTPFTNWTRTGSEIIGPVFFELDWRVDIDGMRTRLDQLLDETPLWDRRTKSLLVTGAEGGRLTVRVVASAADSSALFSLQCLIREDLARWLRTYDPAGLPVHRLQLESGSIGGPAANQADPPPPAL